jgi:phenylalanyl-tRNA synthetase beta chain
MRVPLSWLRELAPVDAPARDVAAALVRAGLEVEQVEEVGGDVRGVVVAEVTAIEDLTEFKKPIRWVQVRTDDGDRSVVCGATNFSVGDRVPLAVPGAVLPGDFRITARETYGRVSDGMICSARELGIGADHSGILVLDPDAPLGADAVEALGLRDTVLDIAVTPDRGYCFSVRGVAREAATAFDVPFADPGSTPVRAASGAGYEVRVDDPDACARFNARSVAGLDPTVPAPLWLRRRVELTGMRSISLVVDVTNYLMQGYGQPIHAYDRARLGGPIVVRRAVVGEELVTLDDQRRPLTPEDLLICDDSGPIGLAGVMGGASTEVGDATTDVLIEAAWFAPVVIGRASRRHRLVSEASKRFERGVDPELGPVVSQAAVDLLAELAGGTVDGSATDVGASPARPVITITADGVSRRGGREYPADVVRHRLEQVGCTVAGAETMSVTPPSWRPDLLVPVDLTEEVLRLEGYATIPSRLPKAPAQKGLTADQRARRRIGRALAAAGLVEAVPFPFMSEEVLDAFGLGPDDERRQVRRITNPVSDAEPLLCTTLLPGLLQTLTRNVGRGLSDVGLFQVATVFRSRASGPAPAVPVTARPSADQLQSLEDSLPAQPWHVAAVLAGRRERAGWWGPGRDASWADAVELARVVARAVGAPLLPRTPGASTTDGGAGVEPWHPGRCAALGLGDVVLGHAGELHPRVCERLDLPPRTVALELELAPLLAFAGGHVQVPDLSPFPPATVDVALVVDRDVEASAVEAALRSGAGALLEDVRLFDVYEGAQVGAGRRSLAYTLRLRAPDRTLTDEDANAVRDAAVAEASGRLGATLRS